MYTSPVRAAVVAGSTYMPVQSKATRGIWARLVWPVAQAVEHKDESSMVDIIDNWKIRVVKWLSVRSDQGHLLLFESFCSNLDFVKKGENNLVRNPVQSANSGIGPFSSQVLNLNNLIHIKN